MKYLHLFEVPFYLNKKEREDNGPVEEGAAAQLEEILVTIQVLFIERKVLSFPLNLRIKNHKSAKVISESFTRG